MRIGFDFHHVLDDYPNQIGGMMIALARTEQVHVISAVGRRRQGTIAEKVQMLIGPNPNVTVHEVVFTHPSQSPKLKTDLALALKLHMFFDDRADVCAAMNEAGILCFRVPRFEPMSDVESDKDM